MDNPSHGCTKKHTIWKLSPGLDSFANPNPRKSNTIIRNKNKRRLEQQYKTSIRAKETRLHHHPL
jgi:hypothetical protein